MVFAALLALMAIAIPANAAKVHQLTSSFGSSGSESGQFSQNKGIAVDQSDGSVYVADSSNFRVQKFDADGNFVLSFGKGVNQTNPGNVCTAVSTDTCGAGTQGSGGSGFDTNGGFSNPTFVAVDPTSGDVYVADSGTNAVDKFTSAGAFISSNDGSGSGSSFGSLAGIAVDASRNLWVYDEFAQMREFDSSGAFITQWNSNYGVTKVGIAVDSSANLYIVRGTPIVEKFSPAGTDLGEVDSSGTATSLAVDPATDDLYVGAGSQVNRFPGGCEVPCSPVESFGAGDIASAAGIAVRGSSEAVYVSDPGNSAVEIFGSISLPLVTTGAAGAIDRTSATLHGTVNPEGQQLTECHFEFVPAAQFEADGYQSLTPAEQVPCIPDAASIPPDSSGHAVSAGISGLEPATTYHFRLVASTEGTVQGSDRTFTTLDQPLIGSQSVEAVGPSNATVSAQINPQGAPTTYHVEYGPTSSYGLNTPESLPTGFQGDFGEHSVSVHISGLAPGTAYHFRFVATNQIGSGEGADATFATYPGQSSFGPCPNDQLRSGLGAGLPDCRAYEQVTPTEKHGANIQGRINLIQASSAGDRVSFFLNGGLPESEGSSSLSPFMASRGPSGWSSAGLLPPTDPGGGATVVGWSEDLSISLAEGPAPDGVGSALYLRDSDSGAFQLGPKLARGSLAGFAADTAHLIFESEAALLPDAPAGQKDQLYDLNHGALTLAGRIPASPATSCDDANGPACVPAPEGSFAGPYEWQGLSINTAVGGAGKGYYTQNTISRDGSKVFFTAAGSGQLYMREDATRTTRISASQRTTPDPNGEKPAVFIAATPDGSKVFFTSCEKLTDDSTAVSTVDHTCTTGTRGQDLYSYDTGSGDLTDLTADSNASDPLGAAVQGVPGVSADGAYVYFVANGVLAPGASQGGCCNLYLSHAGTTTFITVMSGDDGQDWGGIGFDNYSKTARVAPDGTLLMSSRRSLTGYNNEGGQGELFRYSPSFDELVCVSCDPTGRLPLGSATLTSGPTFVYAQPRQTFLTRNLSRDGNRIFFESPDALLPADTNGVTDVYEWEAKGSGSCDSESQSGGCLYLLSSGTSPDPSYFGDASADGDHVFIFTSQPLVPSDGDQLIDVYDAAVDGGLASQHALAPPTCSSTACQANPPPPPRQTLASAVFSGSGNARQRPAARKCPKGKRTIRHAGKLRCQKHKQHKRHTNQGGSK